MIPTCYCQDLQASALWICSMYLFTQPIFLPHYFPVCLCRGWLFSLFAVSSCLSPPSLLSLTHPFSPPPLPPLPPNPPTASLICSQTLSQTHTHAHKHTQRHMLCLAGSEPLTTVCLQKSSFISRSLDHSSEPRGCYSSGPDCPGISPIRDSHIMIRRCFLISIIFCCSSPRQHLSVCHPSHLIWGESPSLLQRQTHAAVTLTVSQSEAVQQSWKRRKGG